MLPEALSSPIALALLTLVIATVLYAQRQLTYTEFRQSHRLKKRVFPPLSRITTLFLVSDKKYRSQDAEYVATVSMNARATFKSITDNGLSPHLLSSLKRRETPEGRIEYSDLHFVKQHGESQSEVYCFVNDDDTVDVYAHEEVSVLRPEDHLEHTEQRDGDVRGVIPPALIQEP